MTDTQNKNLQIEHWNSLYVVANKNSLTHFLNSLNIYDIYVPK